jgi:hypothetical protein
LEPNDVLWTKGKELPSLDGTIQSEVVFETPPAWRADDEELACIFCMNVINCWTWDWLKGIGELFVVWIWLAEDEVPIDLLRVNLNLGGKPWVF